MDELHEMVTSTMMVPFFLSGPPGTSYKDEKGRFALWQIAERANGGNRLHYIHQYTGSCVGAGAGNALTTAALVEIDLGDAEEWPSDGAFWLYPYGQSRRIAGLNGPGEGSFGSAYAKAIMECGIFTRSEEESVPRLYVDSEGWLVAGVTTQKAAATEREWSDGAAWNREPYTSAGKKHLIGSMASIKTVEAAKAAIQNGYPLTIASSFGTRTIRPKNGVNIAEWDDTWYHQMFIDEAWDHPQEGLLFRIGNNWGSKAHPAPTQGEPAGGFYITDNTLSRILADRGTECYAMSRFAGFQLRTLVWGPF